MGSLPLYRTSGAGISLNGRSFGSGLGKSTASSKNPREHKATDIVAKMHTMCYNTHMKTFDWSIEKNEWLRRVRGLTFEDVVFHIQAGDILDIVEHANQARYPGQRLLVVDIEGYACLVPYVETEDTVFLKTIIPSRRMTKHYLGSKEDETN